MPLSQRGMTGRPSRAASYRAQRGMLSGTQYFIEEDVSLFNLSLRLLFFQSKNAIMACNLRLNDQLQPLCLHFSLKIPSA